MHPRVCRHPLPFHTHPRLAHPPRLQSSAAPRGPLALLRGAGVNLLAYVLPAGYPSTVAPSYTSYAAWSAAATVFASAGGGAWAGSARGPRGSPPAPAYS